MADEKTIIPIGQIEQRILLIRGQKVILDSDLAVLYGIPVKRLNQQVQRNIERFPEDFVFRLTKAEAENLKLQSATSSSTWGGRRKLPLAFAEHGAIMAATVLNSEQAVKVSVYVVRAFVKLREMLSTHRQLSKKLVELERKLQKHDRQIIALVEAIRQLMEPPPGPPRKPIGFQTELGRNG